MRQDYTPGESVALSPALEEAIATGQMTRDQAEARSTARQVQAEIPRPRNPRNTDAEFQQFLTELGQVDAELETATTQVEEANKEAMRPRQMCNRLEERHWHNDRSWKDHRTTQHH
jgi:hypothetical protein